MNKTSGRYVMPSMPVAVASVLTGVGVAALIAVAPGAFAAPTAKCTNDGGSVVCQSPGNAEVYSKPQTTTPAIGLGSNGPYGPWGNVPPL